MNEQRTELGDAIHALLDGTEWDADTLLAIADLLIERGYTINPPEGS
jgi:hypothetical protein